MRRGLFRLKSCRFFSWKLCFAKNRPNQKISPRDLSNVTPQSDAAVDINSAKHTTNVPLNVRFIRIIVAMIVVRLTSRASKAAQLQPTVSPNVSGWFRSNSY